ncbi:hypothetical protein WICPIJ_010043 [Wickerhamomyces pijperi]|uniref:Uncharacterized protein n=1 Tax=Wickerhamomyces pijperi TaxID=599730 RepID=A0A9P8TBL2_WICPI|nr:hypothetical protein WICPIJ_010043 [Wickerhamomyces pijperi]
MAEQFRGRLGRANGGCDDSNTGSDRSFVALVVGTRSDSDNSGGWLNLCSGGSRGSRVSGSGSQRLAAETSISTKFQGPKAAWIAKSKDAAPFGFHTPVNEGVTVAETTGSEAEVELEYGPDSKAKEVWVANKASVST